MHYETLPSAPITEAVLDIRVALPSDVVVADLLADLEREFADFPEKRERIQVHVDFTKKSSSKAIDALLLENEKMHTVVHCGPHGFAVSRMKPYPDWDTFSCLARDLWGRYRRIADPVRCSRLGLRYINHIDLAVNEDVSRTLKLFLAVPQGAAPAGLSTLTATYVAAFPEQDATARITLHLPPMEGNATQAVAVLDIDAFQQVDVAPDDAGVWEAFDKLRSVKNAVFFSSITSEARKRYADGS
jgi:uncharacterized protein (TIGR04255 family)